MRPPLLAVIVVSTAVSLQAAGPDFDRGTGIDEVIEAASSAGESLSARIANAYAEAYIDDKLNAKYDATRRAGVWLQERIAVTEERARAAEVAVQKFRGEHDLMSANGELLSDQQLTGLNGQLIAARANVGEAEARYRRIKEIIDITDVPRPRSTTNDREVKILAMLADHIAAEVDQSMRREREL